MIRMNRKISTIAGMAASLAMLSGCFTGNDDGPSAEDKNKSATATAAATTNLGTAVGQMTDFEQFEYGKEDLTTLRTSNADFNKAIALDPSNNKAKMGDAITTVLLAAQSERLSGLINQTLEARSPIDPSLVNGAPLARIAVLKKVVAASEMPEFSQIQKAIEDTLLPALDEAILRLRDVYADPAFSMTLTMEGTVRELDHAEASLLLAGFIATKALVTLFLSYDIDLDYNGSYDYIKEIEGVGDIADFAALTPAQRAAFDQLASILKPGSPFLAVRPAWQARLAKVDDDIKEAMSIVKAGLNSVKNETDDQSDDVIKLCQGLIVDECIDTEEFNQGIAFIDTGLKYIDNPYMLDIPDLDTVIKVDFAAFLRVQDYKKMLPHYGFYPANDWSDAKPVLYFTNGTTETGNIKTIQDLADRAEVENLTARQVVTELKTFIHFQDPTFQGFLPGATEAGIWALLLKAADQEDAKIPVAKHAAATMSPYFALSLLGKD